MDESLTYDLAAAAQRIGGISQRWLAAQLRLGNLPGRKVGRTWRMTEDDIEACLEIFKVSPQQPRPEAGAPASRAATAPPPRRRRNKPVSAAAGTSPTSEVQYRLFR